MSFKLTVEAIAEVGSGAMIVIACRVCGHIMIVMIEVTAEVIIAVMVIVPNRNHDAGPHFGYDVVRFFQIFLTILVMVIFVMMSINVNMTLWDEHKREYDVVG